MELNEIIALITALAGLIGTAVSTFFAIKNWITNIKGKNAQEIWGLILEIADKAMEEAERSTLSGADKKTMAMNIIKTSAEAAQLDITPFISQLNDYIDQTIAFVNKLSKK